MLTGALTPDPPSVPKAPGQSRILILYLSRNGYTKSLDCPGNSPNEVAREK